MSSCVVHGTGLRIGGGTGGGPPVGVEPTAFDVERLDADEITVSGDLDHELADLDATDRPPPGSGKIRQNAALASAS